MRFLAFFLVFTASLRAGVCVGDDPCKACRDCTRCWHCSLKNPQHGSCGVMRAQDGKAQSARDAKRAGFKAR